VTSIESIDRRCQRRVRPATEFRAAYRRIEWPADAGEEWFLSAELQFEPLALHQPHSVQSLLQRRRDTQPLGQWSCGSVFKNPPGDHAARLIEAAGLKGYRIGDAVVSDKHANFIINEGHASAQELEQLIGHVQQSVERLFGIRLEPEVRIVGESASAPAGTQDH
jgi:UDP-N-acetylmuramate dehydrogenase